MKTTINCVYKIIPAIIETGSFANNKSNIINNPQQIQNDNWILVFFDNEVKVLIILNYCAKYAILQNVLREYF